MKVYRGKYPNKTELKRIDKLTVAQPNEELKKHKHYSQYIALEKNVTDEIIQEGKEVLAQSMIDDLEEAGETPIPISFFLKQNLCLHTDVWKKTCYSFLFINNIIFIRAFNCYFVVWCFLGFCIFNSFLF